jgi:hypothetical protein
MARLKAPPARLCASPRALGHQDRPKAERPGDRARRATAEDTLRQLYSLNRWRDLRLEISTRDLVTCQVCGCPTLAPWWAPGRPLEGPGGVGQKSAAWAAKPASPTIRRFFFRHR